jgi:hypothetical protein
MDAPIFDPAKMGLASYVHGKPHRHRSQRVAQWYGARAAARQ